MKKDILLINTSFSRDRDRKYSAFGFPLGILQVESALRQAGYRTQFVDPQIDENYESIIFDILRKEPLFIGMSTYLGENLKNAVEISSKLKSKAPNIPIVWGGPFASSIPEICLEQAPIDYIVMGMGEDTVVKLANYLSMVDPILDTTNVSYKKSGKIFHGTLYHFTGKLDDLPLPDLTLWEAGVRRLQAIPIMTSRGCPRGCNFCYNSFVTDCKYLLRTPDSIIAEMDHWANHFGIKNFYLVDDNFLIDKRRAKIILSTVVNRGYKLKRLMAHLNDFRDEIMPMIYDTTTFAIMCIETASPRIQKLLNKRLDLEKAIKIINDLCKNSITFMTAFMFGLPSETDDDIRASIKMAARIRDIEGNNSSNCYIYAPQPQDMIVKNDEHRKRINFSLEVAGNVEVVPIFPNNKIDLRLRPWMSEEDRVFYLDFVPVWLFHFGNKSDKHLTLTQVKDIYTRNFRIRQLFEEIDYPKNF